MDKNNKSLKFSYVFDDDYNPKYINGAFGGIDPQGEININFYMERSALPVLEDVELDDDGNIGNIVSSPEDVNRRFVRFIQCGVVMSKDKAHEIYKLLENILKEHDGNDK